MKALLKDLLIAAGIMALWILLVWWYTSPPQTVIDFKDVYQLQPPVCQQVVINRYITIDKKLYFRRSQEIGCPNGVSLVVLP